MKAIATWNFILQNIERHKPVMLLYVLDSKGSSPGRQGFFMAVTEGGTMEGSIGGGIMEHKFVELAMQKLAEMDNSTVLRKQYHDLQAKKDRSGMICSGEQTIFMYPVKQGDIPVIRAILASLKQNKNGTLVLSPEGISFGEEIPGNDFQFTQHAEPGWEYMEKTGYRHRLFVIGGGHCSLAFTRLMRTMDFYISVYDDRHELNSMEKNEAAHEKYFVNDYAELAGLVPPGENHYVVIMTMGYRSDDVALRALLEKKFRYIGVLGSLSKMNKMMEEYKKEGIAQNLLDRVHAPVGLPIRSQSPEEIAVSIAAELIRVKNETA